MRYGIGDEKVFISSINWNLKCSNESSEPKGVATIARVRNASTAEALGSENWNAKRVRAVDFSLGGFIIKKTKQEYRYGYHYHYHYFLTTSCFPF